MNRKPLPETKAKVAKAPRQYLVELAHLFGIGSPKSVAGDKPPTCGRKDHQPSGSRRGTVDVPRKVSSAAKVPADPRVTEAKPSITSTADDDCSSEMHGHSPVAQARRRERARCAAIIMSAAGQRNPLLAQALAFETRMTRAEALAYLGLAPPVPDPKQQRKVWNGTRWVPEQSLRH